MLHGQLASYVERVNRALTHSTRSPADQAVLRHIQASKRTLACCIKGDDSHPRTYQEQRESLLWRELGQLSTMLLHLKVMRSSNAEVLRVLRDTCGSIVNIRDTARMPSAMWSKPTTQSA
ncbi:unnamed protein product [Pleuronectes platessa]|uniref:Uncharacterized protein n=1 Tax=Pleuronectes platessa TaxID=8262 RepID=A0A9N7YHD7_PLEPL|nr:unnamed protein product [Pleuronectes platessa]